MKYLTVDSTSHQEQFVILVTGATGQLGALIVENLLQRVPASQVAVSVRDVQKARVLSERGVRVRAGDFENAAGLRHAFEGASQVLIVSSGTTGDVGLRLHGNAINAAKAVGARRILYTSHMGVSPNSLFPPMTLHAATERLLQDSGVAFTSLRNGFYTSTINWLLGNALETGQLIAPEDGPVSWTTHADLAEATAVALAEPGRLEGLTPPLTGSEALDLTAIAAIASELSGRPIQRVIVPDADFKKGLLSQNLPAVRIDITMGLHAASRRGEFKAVDPTLERLLGRKPTTPREFLAARFAKR